MAIGSGMSFTSDLAEAGVLLAEGKLRRQAPHPCDFGRCVWVWRKASIKGDATASCASG